MGTVTFREGRQIVEERVAAAGRSLEIETVPLEAAAGRVLATAVLADRDYPPVDRSIRDGFAVRSQDLPGRLRVVGEVRAGEWFSATLGPGEAVEIYTGAPIPPGCDQVVMVEQVTRNGSEIATARPPAAGEFIQRRGSESVAGVVVLRAGQRLDYARVAQAATVGAVALNVFRRPRVAILATGDEIVEITAKPLQHQVRNSNSYALAAQVARAGGEPTVLPVARDNRDDIRRCVEQGLGFDLLLLSGGVSAGKYDLVEGVLADCGAEFYFDRVRIQPGQPLVFGRARGTFFFGLPGNPASTMVTFEVFARLAIALLSGETNLVSPMLAARLTHPFSHQPGLTRFLPAHCDGGRVTPIPWQGSSDVPALARANAFLVAESDQSSWEAGEWIGIWPK